MTIGLVQWLIISPNVSDAKQMTDTAEVLNEALSQEREWLVAFGNGRTFPLVTSEIELRRRGTKILLEIPTDNGLRCWRITTADKSETEITLKTESAAGRRRETIRLIKRTPAAEMQLNIELGRLRRANYFAETLRDWLKGSRIESVSLNEKNGRMANIFISSGKDERLVAIADVTGTLRAESILTATLSLLERLRQRRRRPVGRSLIIADKRVAGKLSNLRSLLDSRAASVFEILEVDETTSPARLKPVPQKSLTAVLSARTTSLKLPGHVTVSEASRRIININPAAIDCISSQNGDTLRFHGLPFARVRASAGRTLIWFGAGKPRTLLDETTVSRFDNLLYELGVIRQAGSENKKHRLYSALPEAWLESILRRNIGLIDANLILSPIYNQFRTASAKIDLLALRRDGRLVIIELKTSPDRETVFQAADYWRRIELQRRRGELARHRLFDDLEIADRPALVYIVAPALDFHKDFDRFAKMLAPEIELWRFELHREWRSAVKVIERVSGRI